MPDTITAAATRARRLAGARPPVPVLVPVSDSVSRRRKRVRKLLLRRRMWPAWGIGEKFF